MRKYGLTGTFWRGNQHIASSELVTAGGAVVRIIDPVGGVPLLFRHGWQWLVLLPCSSGCPVGLHIQFALALIYGVKSDSVEAGPCAFLPAGSVPAIPPRSAP